MRNETSRRPENHALRSATLHTAQADALHDIYRDTLTAFLASPGAIPVPRAARAMFWLGRLRQWQAIDLSRRDPGSGPDWSSLRHGAVESIAGLHALAMHMEQWNGPSRRPPYERDMSLQVAMSLALGWRDLATFLLSMWFAPHAGASVQHPLGGMTAMIVGVAGKALGVKVPQTIFCRSDTLLRRLVDHWQADDNVFGPLAVKLAERHLSHCVRDMDLLQADFDYPVEHAMPVELLMLLRLRGQIDLPFWLDKHPALFHPASRPVPPRAPTLSRRCASFVESVGGLLPRFGGLPEALRSQANAIRHTGP